MAKNLQILLCLLLSVMLQACQNKNEQIVKKPSLSTLTPSINSQVIKTSRDFEAAEFRTDFFAFGQEQYTHEELASLIYGMDEKIGEAPDLKPINGDFRGGIDSALKDIMPSNLYFNGLNIKYDHNKLAIKKEILTQKLAKKPVTFVVFPGIFVEFSASKPFEEILSNKKSFAAREFAARMREVRNPELLSDASYNVHLLRDVERPMAELINVASIDDNNGVPLVQIVYLNSVIGSLESLGNFEFSTKILLRRLNKFFKIWNRQETLYLLGYSRGAPAALDVLVQAKKNPSLYLWADAIRGVVSLGGALNGSLLADDYLEYPQGLVKIVREFAVLGKKLQIPGEEHALGELLAAISHNTIVLKNSIINIFQTLLSSDTSFVGLVKEHVNPESIDLGVSLRLFKNVLFGCFNLFGSSGTGEFENVFRLQFIGKQIEESTNSISSDYLEYWWKTHELPIDVNYYSIVSTMFDVTKDTSISPMIANPLAIAPRSIDYALNRWSYYWLSNATGSNINDGAVTFAEGTFSPAFVKALNKKQQHFRAYPLAVLASHHWATVMPYGIRTRGQNSSPFPRRLLLLSLGAYLRDRL